MLRLLIAILIMTSCTNMIKENFIAVCKLSSNNIRIEYLDSANGIESIEQQTIQDTLILIVKVSTAVKNQSKLVKLPHSTHYFKIGSRLFDMSKVHQCEEISSGDKALEQLKKMK